MRPSDGEHPPLPDDEPLRGDAESQLRHVGRGAAGIFGGMVAGQAIRLVTALVISRTMGPAVFGSYGLLLGIQRITDVFGHAGVAQANLRFVAQCTAESNPNGVRATTRTTVLLSFLLGTAAMVGLIAFAPVLAGPRVWERPDLLTPLRLMAITVPITCVMFACLTALQGAGRVSPIVTIGRLGVPIATLCGAAVVALLGSGLPGIVVATLVASILGMFVAMWVVWRWLPPAEPGKPSNVPLRRVLNFSAAMALMSGSHLVIQQADMLILPHFITHPEELGWYFAAVRIAAIIAYPMSAISGSFSPAASALASRGDREGLRELFVQTTRWSTGISLLALGIVVIAPELLLGAFGPGFANGAGPLVLLSLGQLVNSATGCNAPMLTMTGQHRLATGTSWAAAVTLVAALPFACAQWGPNGAAGAVVAVIGVNNVVREMLIWRCLRIHPYERRFWIGLWSTLAAMVLLGALARLDGAPVGPWTIGALCAFGALIGYTGRRFWLAGLIEGMRRRPRAADVGADAGLGA